MTAILTPSAQRDTQARRLVMDRSAGFGEFAARVWVNGPLSYRFELSAPGRSAVVFRSCGEVASAVYLSGQPVTWDMPTVRIAELALAGASGAGPEVVRHHAEGWRECEQNRHQVCTDVADRLTSLTARPCFPGYPQWWPDWREAVA